MENYYKGKNVEEELERDKIPLKGLPPDFLWMQVKGGSKMANLLTHASGILQENPDVTIVWSGAGVAIPKAISCTEILKRQFSITNQVTKLTYKKIEEYWEPKVDGLETIVVKREIPVIHILLSNVPLSNPEQLGYQSLHGEKFWLKVQNKQNHQNKQKKPYKHKKPNHNN